MNGELESWGRKGGVLLISVEMKLLICVCFYIYQHILLSVLYRNNSGPSYREEGWMHLWWFGATWSSYVLFNLVGLSRECCSLRVVNETLPDHVHTITMVFLCPRVARSFNLISVVTRLQQNQLCSNLRVAYASTRNHV